MVTINTEYQHGGCHVVVAALALHLDSSRLSL